ncbi:MAG: methyltransferase domain-containing protein [Acutalibacteraceae bacterium]
MFTFPDNTFDGCFPRCYLIPRCRRSFKEWYRVTKKGGKVLYFDANWYYY